LPELDFVDWNKLSPVKWNGDTFHPFLLDIAVYQIASTRQKHDLKHTDATATHAAASSASSGKTAEEHASQHTASETTGHTPHKTATSRLLKCSRSCLLPWRWLI
jgi:hypothetical protein